MRKLRHFATISLFIPLLQGCGDLTNLDINEDPDAATEVSGELLLPFAMVNVASTRAMEIFEQTMISQIFASNGSASVFLNPERYSISPFTYDNTWTAFYTESLKNLKLMRDQGLAETPARRNQAAQAEIFSAYIFWMLTSIFETVPYTQALNGEEFPQPMFDSQETVLRGVIMKLDSAIAMIDKSAGAVPGVVDGDVMFGGNMADWERFANSLKLRTLMMIKNKDASVDAQISALLSQPLIRENSQEAAIPFFDATGNEHNLWKLNDLYGGFINAMNGNEFVFAGKTLVDLMKSLRDPRLNTYFEFAVESFNIDPDGGGPATTEHFGQIPGVSDWDDGHTSMVSQNIIREDWPNRILPAAEVWFFEAEFRALTNDLPRAYTSYRTGVQRALDWFDGKPGAISTAAKTAYLAQLPQSFSSQQAALDAIRAQEYIEVLDRSPENWVHWRRTKYPQFILPQQAVLGGVIRRYPISSEEVSANPNAPTGVPLDRPMWFER